MSFVLVKGPAPAASSPAHHGQSGRWRVAAQSQSRSRYVRSYRHSVVPGGVRSPEEIAYVMERDPVVASHYKNIIPQLMRNERLQQPVMRMCRTAWADKV
jgi:hypothetical protein